MKLLIFGVLLYFAYRVFLKPSMLGVGDQQAEINSSQSQDDGDYVDYEEVE